MITDYAFTQSNSLIYLPLSGLSSWRKPPFCHISSWQKWPGIGSMSITGRCASSSWTASSSPPWSCSDFASYVSATFRNSSLHIPLWFKRLDSSSSCVSCGNFCPISSATLSFIPCFTSFPFWEWWTSPSEPPASFFGPGDRAIIQPAFFCRC